jgi:uncharacterized membrane protein YecN with MAPEG domain
MSGYVAVTVLIFAIVAILHLARLVKGWPVQVGSRSIPMSVSWIGFAVAGLTVIWGVMQSGG